MIVEIKGVTHIVERDKVNEFVGRLKKGTEFTIKGTTLDGRFDRTYLSPGERK